MYLSVIIIFITIHLQSRNSDAIPYDNLLNAKMSVVFSIIYGNTVRAGKFCFEAKSDFIDSREGHEKPLHNQLIRQI